MQRLQRLPQKEVQNLSVLEKLLNQSQDPQRAVTMALDMLLAGIDTVSQFQVGGIYETFFF